MAKGKSRVRVEAKTTAPETLQRRKRAEGGQEPTVRPNAKPSAQPTVQPTVQELQRMVGNQGTLALLRDAGSAAALAAVVQRRRFRAAQGGRGAVGGPVPAVVATMRVQIQCADPRMDLGQAITETAPGVGVTTAQIRAAFNTLLQRLPGGLRRPASDRLEEVMADIAGRVNAATGELGTNNSTSWPIQQRGMRGFRMDVENIRGRNLYS